MYAKPFCVACIIRTQVWLGVGVGDAKRHI